MFCKYCGKEANENEKFCNYCGKEIGSVEGRASTQVGSYRFVRNVELRANARKQLAGMWNKGALLTLVYMVIVLAITKMPVVGRVVIYFISGPFILGINICYLKLIREHKLEIETLFDGFKDFKRSFIVYLLTAIYTALWMCLLFIPGIIAAYRYSMAYYIIVDDKEISSSDAITKSKEMMIGHKWDLFCLQLSFTGWILLSGLTIGIGLFWLVPYMQAATANFYLNLKCEKTDVTL